MLTALAILGLFLTAAFIAYQQTTSRSTRTLLAANVATAFETPVTASPRALKHFVPVCCSFKGNKSAYTRTAFIASPIRCKKPPSEAQRASIAPY
jgi:hypothetical protein